MTARGEQGGEIGGKRRQCVCAGERKRGKRKCFPRNIKINNKMNENLTNNRKRNVPDL